MAEQLLNPAPDVSPHVLPKRPTPTPFQESSRVRERALMQGKGSDAGWVLPRHIRE